MALPSVRPGDDLPTGGSGGSPTSITSTFSISDYLKSVRKRRASSSLITTALAPNDGGTVTLLGQAYGRSSLGGQ